MKKLGILAVALFGLTGCATQWVKYYGTPEEIARDRYECDRDSTQAMIFGTFYAWQIYDRCMTAHGWVQR
jgi:hypothetical protein